MEAQFLDLVLAIASTRDAMRADNLPFVDPDLPVQDAIIAMTDEGLVASRLSARRTR